jgi:hypothetical protein
LAVVEYRPAAHVAQARSVVASGTFDTDWPGLQVDQALQLRAPAAEKYPEAQG